MAEAAAGDWQTASNGDDGNGGGRIAITTIATEISKTSANDVVHITEAMLTVQNSNSAHMGGGVH